jgi:hypothetical protein
MTILELAPCPFCGSEAFDSIYSGAPVIWCRGDDCEASMGGEEYVGTLENLVECWNKRADHSIAGYEGSAGLYYSKRAAVANGEQAIEPVYRVKK